MGIFDKLFGKKGKRVEETKVEIIKDEERDKGGFEQTEEQIKTVTALQISNKYGVKASGYAELSTIIIALCSLPKSSKATVLVSWLPMVTDDPMITKRLIEGSFSLLKAGIPEKREAYVWITDQLGLEDLTHASNKYQNEIGMVWVWTKEHHFHTFNDPTEALEYMKNIRDF